MDFGRGVLNTPVFIVVAGVFNTPLHDEFSLKNRKSANLKEITLFMEES
jgi:hypothetical protein